MRTTDTIHELFRSVYRQAGGDRAADDRARARRPRLGGLPSCLVLARRRLPDDPGADLLSGGEPGSHVDHGDGAARGPTRRDPRPAADDLDQFRDGLDHHSAIRSVDQSRRRRTERAGGDQRRQQPVAERSAGASDLCESQSGRPANPDACGHVQGDVAHAVAGHRQQSARLQDRRGAGSWAGQPGRRQRPGDQGGGGPTKARCLRIEHGRPAHLAQRRHPKPAEGQFRRPRTRLYHQRQRPDFGSQRLSQHNHCLPGRLAGPAARRGYGQPGPSGYRAGRLVQRHAGDRAQRPASAGRQRHQDRRPDQTGAAATCWRACPRRCMSTSWPTAPA